MTDEERTDELIQKAKESYKVYSEDKCVGSYEDYQYIDGYCNGYDQGYEDCRHYAHDYYKPKWHDLRKDPNDLPKVKGYYLVCRQNAQESNISYFNHSEMDFNDIVIAWCELPQFKE